MWLGGCPHVCFPWAFCFPSSERRRAPGEGRKPREGLPVPACTGGRSGWHQALLPKRPPCAWKHVQRAWPTPQRCYPAPRPLPAPRLCRSSHPSSGPPPPNRAYSPGSGDPSWSLSAETPAARRGLLCVPPSLWGAGPVPCQHRAPSFQVLRLGPSRPPMAWQPVLCGAMEHMPRGRGSHHACPPCLGERPRGPCIEWSQTPPWDGSPGASPEQEGQGGSKAPRPNPAAPVPTQA